MARSTLDSAALARLKNDPAILDRLEKLGNDILRDAYEKTPYDETNTGEHLRDTGFSEKHEADGFVRVGYTADYASYVHEGTGPHVIRAKPGGVLAWGGGNFATEVHHPGTDPQPWFAETISRFRGRI